ncbi:MULTISPECIES: YceD family protein [Persicobacter]|uniref:DUF177 domain-containing protein n=1 Tax=Persicobacter diffluens TaxID=981 RepID=A0AAN4VZ77_9BACT|nr:DUF177 domain-containing protein [Persicobacter sp. CCB-QB2]GJM61530.1 hypothetical protein PEDI_20820 [Persicobacter diffluens]
MNTLKKFDIEIFQLGLQSYDYELDFDDSLFNEFEHSIIEKGSGLAKITLKKESRHISMDFDIEAKVELICDRSLEPFEEEISVENTAYFKYGDEEVEYDGEFAVITKDTLRINVAYYIYEFLTLGMPMKRLHPKFREEEEEEDLLAELLPDRRDDGKLVYQSGAEEDSEEEADDSATNDDQPVDPRWEALKNLKKK